MGISLKVLNTFGIGFIVTILGIVLPFFIYCFKVNFFPKWEEFISFSKRYKMINYLYLLIIPGIIIMIFGIMGIVALKVNI